MTQVKGIGDEAPDGWVLEEFEMPMPRTRQEIIDTIDAIIKQGKVQAIRIELGKPISFTRFIKEGEATKRREMEQDGDTELGSVARNVMMEEITDDFEDHSPMANAHRLLYMMLGIAVRKLHLTHVGVGPDTRLFQWLGLDPLAYGGISALGGGKLVRDKHIPDDNVILFGGPHPNGKPDQITYALKCHLFTEEDVEQATRQATGRGGHPGERGEAGGAVAGGAGGDVEEDRGVQPGEDQGSEGGAGDTKAADVKGKRSGPGKDHGGGKARKAGASASVKSKRPRRRGPPG